MADAQQALKDLALLVQLSDRMADEGGGSMYHADTLAQRNAVVRRLRDFIIEQTAALAAPAPSAPADQPTSGFYISGQYPDGNYSICELKTGRVLQLLGADDFPAPLRNAALRAIADQPSPDKQGQQDAHVGPPDWLRLARECGGSIYRHRAIPDEPSVAFGNESWARFTAALSAVAASPAPTEEPRTDGGEVSDGWSSNQPNAGGLWLWREGGKDHTVTLRLCSDGGEVDDASEGESEDSYQSYWMRTPTDQKNMPGLWKRAASAPASATEEPIAPGDAGVGGNKT